MPDSTDKLKRFRLRFSTSWLASLLVTENDKRNQTFSPPLDGKLLQWEGKSSGWSQFPHLENKSIPNLTPLYSPGELT